VIEDIEKAHYKKAHYKAGGIMHSLKFALSLGGKASF
jgi:hypothetical protein